MKNNKANAREKIYQATLELLAESTDASRISSRQIAAKADVNLALINYYYQSKENLLSEVVGAMMEGIVDQIMMSGNDMKTAENKIREIMITTADAAFKHENICKIAIGAELNKGCINSCAMIRPHLEEVYGEYSVAELDIIALQLMLPFHHIFLEPEFYGRRLNTDFFNKEKRDQKINQMIDCILAGSQNRREESI